MSEMISFGAGINSVAMTIMLVNDGWRGPIVFADTGGEHPETYCYIEYFERWLQERGLGVTKLIPQDRTGETAVTLEQYCQRYAIIPLLSVRWCSVKWKRDPVEGFRKQHGIKVSLIGMAAEEYRRVRPGPDVRYPLYDESIGRPECRRIIQRAGLEVPVKSGCFFCPGRNLAEWRRLYYDHPDLYERAALLEDKASEKHGKHATLDTNGISLREHARRRWEGQMEMDLSQWLPCACAL